MRNIIPHYPALVAVAACIAFVAMHPRENPPDATMRVQAPSYSDAQLLALLDEANLADSSAGAFAIQHVDNPDARDSAQLVMADHHTLRVQGQQVAQELNITPAAPERDPVKDAAIRELTVLSSAASGNVFDKAYMDQEIAIHEQVIDLLNQAHREHAEIQRLVARAMSIVQKHLAKARGVETKLGQPRT